MNELSPENPFSSNPKEALDKQIIKSSMQDRYMATHAEYRDLEDLDRRYWAARLTDLKKYQSTREETDEDKSELLGLVESLHTDLNHIEEIAQDIRSLSNTDLVLEKAQEGDEEDEDDIEALYTPKRAENGFNLDQLLEKQSELAEIIEEKIEALKQNHPDEYNLYESVITISENRDN